MFSATRTPAPSFEEYAAAAWSRLYRSAYLLAGNHADAEDLAQQTLVLAWVEARRALTTLGQGRPISGDPG